MVSSYFYNNRLQPNRIHVTTTGYPPTPCDPPSQTANILDFTYGFNLGVANNGNVVSIANNRNPDRSQSFTYDGLNRIKSAETQANSGQYCWGQCFGQNCGGSYISGYDIWANLKKITVMKCNPPMLDLSISNLNRVLNTGFSYDAGGNSLSDGSYSYSYDAENRMKTGAGVTYTYDGDGKRVQKSSGKLYWYGIGSDPVMESDLSGNITDEYVFLGGKRIARRKSPSGEIHYYFADHLGSSRVVTSATGQILDDSDFYPFGGERPVTSATDNNYLFTGKERDTESGLDNFIKRYHASSLGRFMTPDPIGIMKQKLTDPQQWNMYSYARNNPLRFIDPLGMYVCTDQKQCAEFEKARLAVLNSKSSTAADLRAAKAYGKLGDKNGVYVSFADNLKNDRGGTVTRHDTGIEADSSGPNGVRASVNVTIQSNQASNEETLVHEGSHVADRQEFVASLRPDGTSSNPALNLTLRESEIKAYQLSIQHAQRGNLTLNFGPCGLMDECKFPPAMMPAMRDQRINELLDDPRNHYDNLDNFLYPEFKWP